MVERMGEMELVNKQLEKELQQKMKEFAQIEEIIEGMKGEIKTV